MYNLLSGENVVTRNSKASGAPVADEEEDTFSHEYRRGLF